MKRISAFVLALVMVLSLVLVPMPGNTVSAEGTGPVVIKVHYTREDNNYDGWDIYTWGDVNGGGHTLVEENGEMVATVYANANTSSIGFIVRQGGDSWTSKDPGSDRFIEDVYTDLAMVKSGTLHVYCTSGVSDFTVVEGDDVVKDETSEEVQGSQYPIVINVHYTREDGNYEGWDVFQWNGVKVTAFEVDYNFGFGTQRKPLLVFDCYSL